MISEHLPLKSTHVQMYICTYAAHIENSVIGVKLEQCLSKTGLNYATGP